MLGTVFEWYDFFIYGTLASLFGRLFFPTASTGAALLLALATFGVGFGMRPFGAVLFGVLGDRLGRKYTFLVTITMMGIATAAIGFLPTFASIGIAAPILLVTLRALQGLAIGGEYGGAAIYVAEHAPRDKRGAYTSFIQASAIGGFVLSLLVVLSTTALLGREAWESWGWRVPFIFSLLLLGISIWIRLKLAESPVFQAMKAAGQTAKHPLRESFSSWTKVGRVLAAMIGVVSGQAVLFYAGLFQALYFLQNTLRVDDTVARVAVGVSATVSLVWYFWFGWLSDRIGRKKPIIVGCALSLIVVFPLFHAIAQLANPALADAIERNPVVVIGSECSYNPFAQGGQATACGKVLDVLSKNGIAYSKAQGVPGRAPVVTIGGTQAESTDATVLQAALKSAGYDLEKVTPTWPRLGLISLCLVALGFLSGITYAPVAAYLVELFPARVRYTSLSIPYHVSAGYVGGFMPFISQLIVVKTGNPFGGLWYVVGVVAVALVVTLFCLPETAGKELD